MPHTHHSRLINISLRALTLGSKFVFVFFLAKFLEPAEVGLYGLLAAAVGYGIYLVGLEFYTYASRELMAAPAEQRAGILKHQLFVYAIWYLLAAPVLWLLARYELVPAAYVGWIGALVVCEHVAQESNRILIALSQQLFSGIVLFVRMGLWCLIVIACHWVMPATRSIEFVLLAWLAGSLCGALLAWHKITSLIPGDFGAKIDLTWVARGLKVALPLFVASVAVRGLATFDRFFMENEAGLEVVGAYVLYLGVAGAVISFLDAGVVDFAIPKLVQAARSGDTQLFRRELATARKTILIVGGGLVVLCAAVGYACVGFLGKQLYIDQLYLLYWVLLFTTLNVASVVPHLGLYALGKDGPIVWSQICGFGVFVSVYLLAKPLGAVSVMLALCSAWLCILVWKTLAYRRLGMPGSAA